MRGHASDDGASCIFAVIDSVQILAQEHLSEQLRGKHLKW
jgi:hypothetical protein